jgi:co-chaperonin GroES (HSP10)
MPSSSKPKITNLGKIGDARLDLVPALADCKPGIRPVEYNVIVAPVPSTEAEGKIGSIFIPDDAKETLDLAMQVGRIIAQSPLAYDYAKWSDDDLKPQIGQIVWFARYAGKEFEGADGKTYRILKDKDIGAVIKEAAAYVEPLAVNQGMNNPHWPMDSLDGRQHTLSKTGT